MHILAIEPYYGGSHQAFLDGLVRTSRHRWTLATLPARHWKWRMRSAPVELGEIVSKAAQTHGRPDVVFSSGMLDLPTWLGFATRDKRLKSWVSDVPLVTYFHENQWAYPTAPDARIDHHFGYTNLLSAAASDACWFNSEFNRRSFLEGSAAFVKRMPDARGAIDLHRIADSSRVIAPGFRPPAFATREDQPGRPVRLGWVGRFEHDKRPDRFADLLSRLDDRGEQFELFLLGRRGKTGADLQQIRERFGDRILFDRFAKSRAEYESKLREIDIVVSTADHEFFGIAMCEAIWAGAVPVTPDGLSYVEYIPEALRYHSLDHAAEIIAGLSEAADRDRFVSVCRSRISRYRLSEVAGVIDGALQRIAE
jgi:glycosyltransferase involved in cell wall biosynthesis